MSKMVNQIMRQQTLENDSDQLKSKNEEDYEISYRPKFYDLFLYGKNLNEFPTIYNRVDEIKRCVGVNPDMVLPIFNKSSEIVKYKVRVKNYKDYRALVSEWPNDAFKTGVKIVSKPLNLKVVILNVRKKLKIANNIPEIKKLCQKYGLLNIKRIYNHKNKPCNKLIATCKTIGDFVSILKTGVKFENNQDIHQVLPNIVSVLRCLRCSEIGHSKEKCKSFFKQSINCSESHECYSEKCEKFAAKKIKINSYTLKILAGEKFIDNFDDIFVFKNSCKQKTELKKLESPINQAAELIISTKLEPFSHKLESLERIFRFQNLSLSSIREDTADLMTSIKSVYENLDKYKVEINTIGEQMNKTFEECLKTKNEVICHNNELLRNLKLIHERL
ncbi:unnamed protein product [Brachionus calyciflorus]|uniref:Uncharacterized protein n=1 Tax=Brachionus calyciflorus TaxID=104777 RepID=A0A813NJ66_9BILA|nr:unnamed protein product [Brachionus calyciflorus]